MFTANIPRIPSSGFVAVVAAFLISIGAFGFLKDFIVFLLSKMYDVFIVHN
jgi:hypothetical protein